jgi:hypothetical protein
VNPSRNRGLFDEIFEAIIFMNPTKSLFFEGTKEDALYCQGFNQ